MNDSIKLKSVGKDGPITITIPQNMFTEDDEYRSMLKSLQKGLDELASGKQSFMVLPSDEGVIMTFEPLIGDDQGLDYLGSDFTGP